MLNAIYRGSLLILAGALCLSPLAVFLALPVIDLGVFRQVETVAVSIHLLAAFVAFGIMGVSIGRPSALSGAVGLPAAFALCMGVVSAFLAPFALDPLRSIHGSLEHGVGALWFVELAVFVVGATVVRRESPRAFALAAIIGALTVATCFGLELASIPYGRERLVPYDFKGYLGTTALLAAVPILAIFRSSRSAWAAALALSLVAIFGNRSALLTLAVAVPCYFLLARFPIRPRRGLAVLAVALMVLGTAGVAAVAPLVERSVAGAPRVATIPSERAIDHVAVQLKPYGTIWQRSVTGAVAWSALLVEPRRFLTGMGFGSFETVAILHRGEVPGRQFVVPTDTSSLAYWDGDQKAKFHSHNLWLESLLSAGVVGALVWLCFVAGVARSIGKANLAAGVLLVSVLTVSGSLWFLVNSSLPLLALGLASLLPGFRLPAPAVRPGIKETGWTLASALAMGVFAFAGTVSYASAKGQILERYFPPLMGTPSGPPCIGYNAMAMPNRQTNVNLYRIFVRSIEDRKAAGLPHLAERFVNLANFSCVMRKYVDEFGDVEALETSLRMRARVNALLGENNPVIQGVIGPDFAYWKSDLERWLAVAPSRGDLVIPYLGWVAAKGDMPALDIAASHFAGLLKEGDPVRSYAEGLRAQAQGKEDEGRTHMARAFRQGLANLLPVGKGMYDRLVGALGAAP